jgi:hypothetical protein
VRLVAWSGAAVVGLMALSLGALPASVVATGNELAAVYVQNRTAILASMVLGCLAWSGAFLVYLAALHQALRARQDETTTLLAGVGFAGGIVNAAVIVLSVFALALAAFRSRDPALSSVLQDATFLANTFTGCATAVCVGSFSPALWRVGFPSWLVVLGVIVVFHHLASAFSLSIEGFWSPSGPVSTSAPLGMTLWVGCVAALAWQRRDRM